MSYLDRSSFSRTGKLSTLLLGILRAHANAHVAQLMGQLMAHLMSETYVMA
jgi:hypothetical protein